MPRLIKASDGLFIAPCKVIAVKRAGEDKCSIFFEGQAATDGFLVARDVEDLVDEINEELAEYEDD